MIQQLPGDLPPADWCSVVDVFAANARRFPNKVAVETDDEQRTYAELAARVDVLAAVLAAAQIGTDDPLIGVCLARNVDLPAWLLAILKVGCAYVPIDYALPPARIAQILKDSAPALIVASRCHAAALAGTSVPMLVAEDVNESPCGRVPSFPAIPPDALAYVIFTSGSTGRPKGVEIEQGSLVALMRTMAVSPGLRADEKMLGLTRLSFDLSVPDMFLPLFVGGSLALIDPETTVDPDRLVAALRRFAPDLVQATPSFWRLIVESGWNGAPGLRIVAGGETVTRALADRLSPCCDVFWNIYGPTEATVWATIHRVIAGESPIPIGRTTPGVIVHVADSGLQPLPAGQVGEILIGGVGVARGYRNRPDLTAERFVTLADGERVYRTGDFGRIDDAGDLVFLGRMDDQIKIRGHRIELGDVEAALASHPLVSASAARLWTDAAGEPTLVGFVVPQAAVNLKVRDVKAFLGTQVPTYLVPDRIISLDAMPLTGSGKIHRAALPSPFISTVQVIEGLGNETIVSRLAVIWRDLLGIDAIGETDDFFDLGGYSLMTVWLALQIETTFGVKLALIELLQHPTLTAMALLIEHGSSGSTSTMLLNNGGDRPPLFWLDAGPVMRTMLRLLPGSQPAYALNVGPGDEAALGPGAVSIPDVARRLRAHLVARQPAGPYYLGGWCRWAFVALELASQLSDAGEEVGLLVVLDAEFNQGQRRGGGYRSRISRWMRLKGPPSGEPESFSQRIEIAARTYRPPAYSGAVLLYRSEMSSGDGGWGAASTGQFAMETVPGDHISMVRLPLARTIAASLGSALTRAQASPVDQGRTWIAA